MNELIILSQMAIGTDDVYKTAQAIKKSGGKITREPAPVPGINTKITACEDPDGWRSVLLFDCCHFLSQSRSINHNRIFNE